MFLKTLGFFLVASLSLIDFSAAASVATTCTKTYSVAGNDTCIGIERKFHIKESLLLALNPHANCTNLQIGEKLCVKESVHCTTPYKIAQNDTCFGLEKKYKISATQWVLLNPYVNCNSLQVGDTVCLAAAPAAPKCTLYYKIKKGDICANIEKKYKITSTQWKTLNPSVDCSHLQIGEKVCLSTAKQLKCTLTYKIKAGDTCSKLENTYHLSASQFKQLNPTLDCNSALQIGTQICLSSS